VRLWDLWDPQLENISRIQKPHGFRKTTLMSLTEGEAEGRSAVFDELGVRMRGSAARFWVFQLGEKERSFI
jgi:hypothetical protein